MQSIKVFGIALFWAVPILVIAPACVGQPALGTDRIAHCPKGCPSGAPETNTRVIREIYTLSANRHTKLADWVAYRITAETIGTSKDLNRSWRADPLLLDDETLEPEDYRGASKALAVDRGHQAPLAAFAGTLFWRDTNYLSNITPQKKALNQGPWRILEERVRTLAFERREVYVLTRPVFDSSAGETASLPGADEPHSIPSGYWKIIYQYSGASAAFFFPQETPRNANYCAFQSDVNTLEGLTGLDFSGLKIAGGQPSGSLMEAIGC